MKAVDEMRNCAGGEEDIWEPIVLSPQFLCKSKTALKNKVLPWTVWLSG